jgi:hypothetical protein
MFANAISCTEFKRDEELHFSGYINEEKALVEAAGMAYISIPLKLQFQTDYELDHHLHTAEIERLVATLGSCMCLRGEGEGRKRTRREDQLDFTNLKSTCSANCRALGGGRGGRGGGRS